DVATGLNVRGHRQLLGPVAVIDVAAHHVQGRERAQRLEQLGPADVARADDEVRAAQRVERLRPQGPVRVGDDADAGGVHWGGFVSEDRSLRRMARGGATRRPRRSGSVRSLSYQFGFPAAPPIASRATAQPSTNPPAIVMTNAMLSCHSWRVS